ncbi:putative membrane protein [Spirosoma lacussanchae]|uniref:carotenoid biosynthesis protein n=1 Tax=Spirosoma lacussanchae TaxID=1884249 RepID=UPI00110881B1|nr:carotenoid biosynthesis protein [Spirosoma lacussanchae]
MRVSLPIPSRYHYRIRTVLLLAYLAGIIGLQLPALADYFRPLSPLTLISSLIVLLLYHTDWRPSFYVYILVAFLTGFFIEVLGVHTGIIFGQYAYGRGLGFQIWRVPPVIGLNWLTLSYCCGSVWDRLPAAAFVKTLAAATTMVLLDLFIEPVAISLDFWTWFDRPVPLQNYIGWWIVSVVLFSIWFILPFRKENRIAKWLLGFQFLFFVAHYLLILLKK